MKRIAQVASQLRVATTAVEASVEASVDVDLTQVLDWPIFDGDVKVDDAFVQRFLTEGFLTITPDMPEGYAENINARLKEMTPPVVTTEEEGEALKKVLVHGVDRGYLVMNDEGKVTSANGKRTTEYDNSKKPVLPELDEMLEAPNVKKALTALLGNNYMVDADRGSNFTIPGRKAGTDWHRDGNDKRRHQHPRMLMGLYYPQAVHLKMGPTAVVARSHWLSDFDPAYQNHDVLSTPRQSTAGVNNCGDYLGTGRGGAKNPMSIPPEHLGLTRYMAVPAGTFMIMFYDTWHRATSSSLDSDLLVPVEARNPEDTRHMCKFRFWRMEEPSAPTWDHNPARAFDPPVDAPFPDHLRITPATRSVFNWMTGHADCATKHDPKADALSRLSTDTLIQRLTWYSEEWSVELDAQFRRSTGPTNPHVTPETGQPAVLASLTAGYELASRGPDALEQLITACMCGGVTITPDRALGAWAAYNASYGLASAVPTPEALAVILPPCIETLKGNPYALTPPELRVARDYAAFIAGELASSAVASDTMRPLLAAASSVESLVFELAAALVAVCVAPAECIEAEAVPQYSAALEATTSLGQALRAHYLAVAPEASLDAILAMTAALAAAAADEEEDKAAIRAEGTDKRFSDPKNPNEKKKNGAAIPPWVHARIGMARLGVGTDARGVPLKDAAKDGRTLNLSLIDRGSLTFTVRAT